MERNSTARQNTPDVVISSDTLTDQVDVSDKDSAIKKVASYLREDIQEYCRSLPALSWPPTVEELCADNRLPPASVTLFLTNLFKSSDHASSKNVNRLVDSYSADLIHGVSGGSFITQKHFLLGLGLHNLTGKREVIQITNRLGHSISYYKTSEIELNFMSGPCHLNSASSSLSSTIVSTLSEI